MRNIFLFLLLISLELSADNNICGTYNNPDRGRGRGNGIVEIEINMKGDGCPEFATFESGKANQEAFEHDFIRWECEDDLYRPCKADKDSLLICPKVHEALSSKPICRGLTCSWWIPEISSDKVEFSYDVCIAPKGKYSCDDDELKCLDPVIIISKDPIIKCQNGVCP